MGSLRELRRMMFLTMALVFIVFVIFISGITFVFQTNPAASLIVGLFIAGLFMLFYWAIGPFMVRLSTHPHYLSKGENPFLEGIVGELASKSGVKMPHLAITPDRTPNAFVFGRTSSDATLAVNQGLLENLNQDEIRGVIGHELGHIKHRDYIVVTMLAALPLIAYVIARSLLQAEFYGGGSRGRGKNNSAAYLLAIAALAYVVYFLSHLLVLFLTRLRESYADAYSAYLLGNPRALESALTKIAYGLSLAPEHPNGARGFFFEDPVQAKSEVAELMQNKSQFDLDHDGVLNEKELELAMQQEALSTWHKVNGLFATHPPVFKRILMLRQIEQEQATGHFTEDRVYAHV